MGHGLDLRWVEEAAVAIHDALRVARAAHELRHKAAGEVCAVGLDASLRRGRGWHGEGTTRC